MRLSGWVMPPHLAIRGEVDLFRRPARPSVITTLMRAILRFFQTALVLVTLFGFGSTASAAPRVVAYVPNRVDLNTFAPTIDYAKLTHINIAFENPHNAEGELSFNSMNRVLIATARTNGVKVLVSIGGGKASPRTNEGRKESAMVRLRENLYLEDPSAHMAPRARVATGIFRGSRGIHATGRRRVPSRAAVDV